MLQEKKIDIWGDKRELCHLVRDNDLMASIGRGVCNKSDRNMRGSDDWKRQTWRHKWELPILHYHEKW